MSKKAKREFHYILMYDTETKEWTLDEDSEGFRFPNGNIWNKNTNEWELGYIGEGEYTEGELENMDKVLKALDFLNKRESE